MGQINLKKTAIPITPDTDRVGLYFDASGNPYKINDAGSSTPLGGAQDFTDLGDVPSSYTGQAGKTVVVNGGETALEFATPAGGGTVTSVAVSGSDGIEIDSGSPVTTSGTIALGLNKSTTKTFLDYLEEEIPGTAAEDLTLTGAENISLNNNADMYLKLTGNTTITFTDTPAVNTSIVRSYAVESSAAETLGIANSTDEFGTYAADGTINEMTVKASNYSTEGLIIRVFFQQPN